MLLTGLHFSAGTVAVAADGEAGAFCCENAYAPSHLFGTGDLYAAALTAALVRGHSLRRAAAIAGDFTALCARRTAAEPGRDPRFGVRFEDSLGELIAQLGAAQN